MTATPKNHTLSSGTSPYSPNKEVTTTPPPPRGRGKGANIIGNTLTRSEGIGIYTPYDGTIFRPRKTKIAFFANFGGIKKTNKKKNNNNNNNNKTKQKKQKKQKQKTKKNCAPERKFEKYESVQHAVHRLQFSGIKMGAKISFHRHFKYLSNSSK